MNDLIIQGVYVPRLFVLAFIAILLTIMLRFVLIRAKLMNVIWHPALFESAVFIVLLQLLTNISFGS